MSEEELRARHVKHVNLTLTGFSQAFEDGLYTTSWTRDWAPRLGIDLGARGGVRALAGQDGQGTDAGGEVALMAAADQQELSTE